MQQINSSEDRIKSEDTNKEAQKIKAKFQELYSISNLFERQYQLLEASRQYETYQPDEFCRLFEAYCQQQNSMQQINSSEDRIKSEGINTEAQEIKAKFKKLYSISNLFERQYQLLEASRQQETYQSEEYCGLFEAYCQQRFRWMLVKRATQLFGIVSSLTVIIAVFTFIRESAGREQQLRASAWQVITSNENTIANAGRKEALEYLNTASFRWKITPWFLKNSATGDDDRVILSGLKVPNAHLSLVKLPKARLQGANFQNATLYKANFAEANLAYSNFSYADLTQADLTNAHLVKANLADADLTDAKLKDACLRRSNLREAHLKGNAMDLTNTDFKGAIYDSGTNIQGVTSYKAVTDPTKQDQPEQKKGMILIGRGRNLSRKDLREANLRAATLRDTNLKGANLQAADLDQADLQGADLDGANLYKVRNLKKKQLVLAKNWQKAYYGDDLKKELEASEKGLILKDPKEFKFSGEKIQDSCKNSQQRLQG